MFLLPVEKDCWHEVRSSLKYTPPPLPPKKLRTRLVCYMALLIIPVLKRWSRARGPYGYLWTWNWPITACEISQPYNKVWYLETTYKSNALSDDDTDDDDALEISGRSWAPQLMSNGFYYYSSAGQTVSRFYNTAPRAISIKNYIVFDSQRASRCLAGKWCLLEYTFAVHVMSALVC